MELRFESLNRKRGRSGDAKKYFWLSDSEVVLAKPATHFARCGPQELPSPSVVQRIGKMVTVQ